MYTRRAASPPSVHQKGHTGPSDRARSPRVDTGGTREGSLSPVQRMYTHRAQQGHAVSPDDAEPQQSAIPGDRPTAGRRRSPWEQSHADVNRLMRSPERYGRYERLASAALATAKKSKGESGRPPQPAVDFLRQRRGFPQPEPEPELEPEPYRGPASSGEVKATADPPSDSFDSILSLGEMLGARGAGRNNTSNPLHNLSPMDIEYSTCDEARSVYASQAAPWL